ncbi:MAG: hypothetical protein EAZ32_11840 [Cytophagia bacterium]|nr:MAG: hypothetical protein EAZ38_12575 [Cytophagales bacterium]TAG38688.1 MAG: hypothetical protein EAZ32_11840 [Cytophagia bacterium]TAG51994.1 MAG: hypothetical protein EAZ27_12885 [Cytophagales bacterium]
METVEIEMNDSVAKKWRNSPLAIRKSLEKKFEEQIEMVDRQIHFQKLETILEEIGKQAQQNGLTEEILKDLLKDE